MKIAHLILAHKNPKQVLLLIETLQHPDFGFFIHIDRKADIEPFQLLIKKNNVFFVKKRAKVNWGDWGTIQATLNGFEEIIPLGYDYVNIISGQDLPIKSANFIYDYFEKHRGSEFITCDFITGEWSDVASRVEEYHLVNWRIPGRFRLSKLLSFVLPKRTFPVPGYLIAGRANWFSLTKEAIQYAVDFLGAHPEVVKFFKYCWGADEFIFSTILYNSTFKDQIRDNLVYVDWGNTEIGHPRLLGDVDYEKLRRSDKLFARKFDLYADPSIFNMIKKIVG